MFSALPATGDTKDAAPFRGASYVSSQAVDSKNRDPVIVDHKTMSEQPSSRARQLSLTGVSFAELARLNGISPRWARRLRAKGADVSPCLDQPSLEEAVKIAQSRAPGSHLSYWSRLAMAHYRNEGLTRREIAELFKVCLNTVSRAIAHPSRGFTPISGTRVLSSSQLWIAKKS